MLCWMLFHFVGPSGVTSTLAPAPTATAAAPPAAAPAAAASAGVREAGRTGAGADANVGAGAGAGVSGSSAGAEPPASSAGAEAMRGVVASTKPMSEFAMRKTYWVLYEARISAPSRTICHAALRRVMSFSHHLPAEAPEFHPIIYSPAPTISVMHALSVILCIRPQGFDRGRAESHGSADRLERAVAAKGFPGGPYGYDAEAR